MARILFRLGSEIESAKTWRMADEIGTGIDEAPGELERQLEVRAD